MIVSNQAASELIRELKLNPGSFFTNTEPSDLCAEYRVETGYYLPHGREVFLKRSTTKDDGGNLVTKNKVLLSLDILGVCDEDSTEEAERCSLIVGKIREIVSRELFDLPFSDEVENFIKPKGK